MAGAVAATGRCMPSSIKPWRISARYLDRRALARGGFTQPVGQLRFSQWGAVLCQLRRLSVQKQARMSEGASTTRNTETEPAHRDAALRPRKRYGTRYNARYGQVGFAACSPDASTASWIQHRSVKPSRVLQAPLLRSAGSNPLDPPRGGRTTTVTSSR